MSDPLSHQKRFGRRGVDALFSPRENRSRVGFFMGIASVAVGLVLWTFYIVGTAHLKFLRLGNLDPFGSIILPPMGLFLVITGIGISLSSRAWFGSAGTDGSALEQDAQDIKLLGEKGEGIPEVKYQVVRPQRASFKLGTAVFIESFFVLLLYAGVVDEYQANLSMQDWVRVTLPSAQTLVNQETLTIVSAILALILIQFLPGKRLHS